MNIVHNSDFFLIFVPKYVKEYYYFQKTHKIVGSLSPSIYIFHIFAQKNRKL